MNNSGQETGLLCLVGMTIDLVGVICFYLPKWQVKKISTSLYSYIAIIDIYLLETYSESSQASNMKLFSKIVVVVHGIKL